MAGIVEPFRTPRSPAITFPTIGSVDTWPKAESSKCCIFEAVNIVGRAQFREKWTGAELMSLVWIESPETAEARQSELTILSALQAKRVTSAPRPFPSIGAYQRISRRTASIEADAFELHVHAFRQHTVSVMRRDALKNEQRAWVHNSVTFARLKATVDWLAQRFRDGELHSYYRMKSGNGILYPMLASDWNVEFPMHNLVSSGGYDRWFYHSSPPSKFPVYLFLDRDELERSTSVFAGNRAEVSKIDLGTLSPYLQMAVKLALKNGYTSEEDCDTKQVREIEVREAWAEALPDVPRSALGVETIAWVMGFPNPVAIERGKLGAARRKQGSPPNG